jgi:hypothetical protein
MLQAISLIRHFVKCLQSVQVGNLDAGTYSVAHVRNSEINSCDHFFSVMLWDIDLIFGMWVYNDKLQISFAFRSSPWIQVNISNQSEIVVTTKYLAKLQSPMAVSWPKIIQPERISKLICNLWLYTLIPKIKSSWAMKFGQIFSCHHFFFTMIWDIDLIFGMWI